jgi:hypothetical protein
MHKNGYQELLLHFIPDNSNEDGSPSEFERSKYAAFIYLNDDFSGGYLNFKIMI